MKKIIVIASVLVLTACGYSAKDIETIGQIKKVVLNTPLVCPDFYDVDVSLGIMRNGTGSMSIQDIWIVVNKSDLALLKKANESGDLVKFTYDNQRFPICTGGKFATKVEVTQ